jgi:pimeloyl-ACP methyl ester carboxylesterase
MGRILGRRHLEHVLRVYRRHYNEDRPHRALRLVPPRRPRLNASRRDRPPTPTRSPRRTHPQNTRPLSLRTLRAWRELVRRDVERARDIAASQNHSLIPEGDVPSGSISSIAVPTLVIHGTADPRFPLARGQVVAEEIPGARLLTLERAGHGVDRADWEPVGHAILAAHRRRRWWRVTMADLERATAPEPLSSKSLCRTHRRAWREGFSRGPFAMTSRTRVVRG